VGTGVPLSLGISCVLSSPTTKEIILGNEAVGRADKECGAQNGADREETGKKLTPLIFDHQELLARVENDRELLRDLLTIFKEDFRANFLTLREAVEAKDGDLVATAAHTLRGMLSNLAASQAAATAARLEQMGTRKKFWVFKKLRRIRERCQQASAAMDACMERCASENPDC